ncbi:PIGU [Symbiodinium natans]|uniref:PIGU protein n=1 Tax=Symbiodinium natans TaxID=878477 RepID=A0A812RQ92_9DINO|nr:PIGU [Symbiodinium natans]
MIASTTLTTMQVAEGLEEGGLFYLLNPLTVASCVALSVQNLQHLFLVFAVVAAGAGKGGLSAAGIAASLYVCPFTPVLLVLPCACLAYNQQRSVERAKEDREHSEYDALTKGQVSLGFLMYSVCFLMVVLCSFVCLLGASMAAMAGELQFVEAAFLSVLSIRDLTPNTGFFWYFFIEVFQRYYLLFVFAFHAHILFYSVPLHLRLGSYAPTGPFIHCSAAIGMISLFKPYPTASDYALMVSAMLVQAELIRESQRYFAFLLSGVMFGLSMVPTMVAVWLGRNAGNANYLYNMTLVVNVFGSLTLSEWVKAGMRLRKRQFRLAYFRKLVLAVADEVSANPAAAKARASVPAPDADTTVT